MKNLRRLLQLVIMTCALFLMCVGVSAKTNSLIDQAHILTSQQRTQIAQELAKVEQKHQVRLAVITVKNIKGNDINKYTDTVLAKNYTEGTKGNMVLLVDMQKKQWCISQDAKMQKVLPKNKGLKDIKAEITPLFKKGQYAKAFSAYASKSDSCLAAYAKTGKAAPAKNKAAASTTKKEKSGFSFIALLGALILGGGAAYGYGENLKKSMTNVAPAKQADEYLQKDTYALTTNTDIFLYDTVVVVPNPQDKDDKPDEYGNESDSFGEEGSAYETHDEDADDGGDFDDSEDSEYSDDSDSSDDSYDSDDSDDSDSSFDFGSDDDD